MSFFMLISKQICIEISPHFDSMFLKRSNFDVFIFTYIEISFTGRENEFCVLEYTRSQSNKTVHL